MNKHKKKFKTIVKIHLEGFFFFFWNLSQIFSDILTEEKPIKL